MRSNPEQSDPVVDWGSLYQEPITNQIANYKTCADVALSVARVGSGTHYFNVLF